MRDIYFVVKLLSAFTRKYYNIVFFFFRDGMWLDPKWQNSFCFYRVKVCFIIFFCLSKVMDLKSIGCLFNLFDDLKWSLRLWYWKHNIYFVKKVLLFKRGKKCTRCENSGIIIYGISAVINIYPDLLEEPNSSKKAYIQRYKFYCRVL